MQQKTVAKANKKSTSRDEEMKILFIIILYR